MQMTASPETAAPSPGEFRHVRQTLAFEDMAGIRDELALFLQLRGMWMSTMS